MMVDDDDDDGKGGTELMRWMMMEIRMGGGQIGG